MIKFQEDREKPFSDKVQNQIKILNHWNFRNHNICSEHKSLQIIETNLLKYRDNSSRPCILNFLDVCFVIK